MSAPSPYCDSSVPGEVIPLHYHYNMLRDKARLSAFRSALAKIIPEGGKVLELGGGTGIMSFYAAQRASKVWCVERDPKLVDAANRLLAINPHAGRVQVILADASEWLPPERVDVVICEMVHVAILREKQIQVINAFKRAYAERFGGPLPLFAPEAAILAVQPIQQNFEFEGFKAPVPLFFDPLITDDSSTSLGAPTVYQMFQYDQPLQTQLEWQGEITITEVGQLNALRFITKNIVAILVEENRTIDWHSQYLVMPLSNPVDVKPGDVIRIRFSYQAGESLDALSGGLEVVRKNR
jgi:predicted RNA methylase